jgi:hypothetical protein
MKFILILLFVAASHQANCSEKIFGYTNNAEPFPKGAKEIYFWLTSRSNKGTGTYQAYDVRQEFEYGLTDDTAVSVYLNERYHKIEGSAPLDDTGSPEYPDRDQFEFQGLQMSINKNFSSPYQNPLGFSLYIEPGYSRIFKITGQRQDEYSIEVKFMFQKNFDDDQVIWAMNISPELETRSFEGESVFTPELAFEVTTGVSWRLGSGYYLGVEGRYHSEYPELILDKAEHYGVFLGPTLHYGAEGWWANLTYLPQIKGWMEDPNKGGLHLAEHEVSEIRFITAITF